MRISNLKSDFLIAFVAIMLVFALFTALTFVWMWLHIELLGLTRAALAYVGAGWLEKPLVFAEIVATIATAGLVFLKGYRAIMRSAFGDDETEHSGPVVD